VKQLEICFMAICLPTGTYWMVGCWRGYVSGSRCRFVSGPADATITHYLLLGNRGTCALWTCPFI